MQEYRGTLDGKAATFALVVSRFNLAICQRLLSGALKTFERHGVAEDALSLFWVPGAFELPLVAQRLAKSKKYDAILCIGTVIRGETAHFEYVADQAAAGILQTSLETQLPIVFSVLTTETVEQAEARSQEQGRNIGANGALSAIEMVNLLGIIDLET